MKPGPKPLYRSLTFWSGIFVMLFIGWAWRDSMRMSTYAQYDSLGITHEWGMISIGRSENKIKPRHVMRNRRLTFEAAAFPLPLFIRGGGEKQIIIPRREKYRDWVIVAIKAVSKESWYLFLPHWLLMLAVALPWAGLLVWRARRMSRAKDTLTTP